MTGGILHRVKVYKDTINDITYICDADDGSLLTDPVWRVKKYKLIDDQSEEHRETDWYKYAVPDLATVQTLPYN